MSLFLGIDTSNYTSSAALYDDRTGTITMRRQLLKVRPGEKGLRQSDAVFAHLKNLPPLAEDLLRGKSEALSAVGASVRPRDLDDSYMPCFEAGNASARVTASAAGIPFYDFSHQAGHIAAALFSADALKLLKTRFIAFHVSGGTTEAVLCTPPDDCPGNNAGLGSIAPHTEIIARSLDLKAGQAVDRVGVMLGLPFPAGLQLEKLALASKKKYSIKPCLKGADCCLSGIENLCAAKNTAGEDKCDIARFCIESILAALDGMAEAVMNRYPGIPLLFAGGVMSNSIMRNYLADKYGALFAKPEYSSDNAAGIAVLTGLRHGNKNSF